MEDAFEPLDVPRGDEAYGVPRICPREAKRLLVHEAPYERVLPLTTDDLEVDAVYVERIIHHILKATALHRDLPPTGYEVRGVGLRGEVPPTLGAKLHGEVLQMDVFRALGKEAHSLSKVNRDVVELDVLAPIDEDGRLGTIARTSSEDRPVPELCIPPVRSVQDRSGLPTFHPVPLSLLPSQLPYVPIGEEHVGGAVA